ncbi:DUF4148 domain-containing protein [Cupriavidus consociatus]|uniref:DUF4148 domain-containing protein n=1 Tax=Cupriavidus consociatus TaxID=2821357 RepID=UPI001AE71A26|nr:MULTISPECIES: DUF4148 domain-containing protein [unclassified Cupriavidus]MBP0618760.1 DUF4148 domain-containing protein [Cupriavidus sp. LEh25]MDK2655401.1 DUF4148 domain-containing protein [Cupriavidus sp. LEh21]
MKRITIPFLAAALMASSLAFPAHGHAADTNGTSRTLTREEVRADLEAWHRAGMSEYWRGDRGPNFDSAEYQKRFALYQRLRAEQAAATAR